MTRSKKPVLAAQALPPTTTGGNSLTPEDHKKAPFPCLTALARRRQKEKAMLRNEQRREAGVIFDELGVEEVVAPLSLLLRGRCARHEPESTAALFLFRAAILGATRFVFQPTLLF